MLYLGTASNHLGCPSIPLKSGSRRLKFSINAPIETYQAIRFDTNANATMNMDQAAVDIGESSDSAMTIMALPRELRDFIYEDLLSSKYPFDAYQIVDGVLDSLGPPTFTKPCSDSRATIRHDPATEDCRIVPYNEFRHKSGELPYKYPFPPRPSLSILQTPTRTRREALHILYQKSTLLFVLNHPSYPPLSSPLCSPVSSTQSQELISHFNNVEIFLDLVSIFYHSSWPPDEITAINLTMELIEKLGDTTSAATTCTLSTLYAYHNSTFETSFIPRLLDTGGNLCVFKKVVLRFGNRLRIAEGDYPGSSAELAAERLRCDEWALDIYGQLLKNAKFRCLGPCEKFYDSEGFYCVVYHPKHQVDAGSD